jgi:hypothetical protein
MYHEPKTQSILDENPRKSTIVQKSMNKVSGKHKPIEFQSRNKSHDIDKLLKPFHNSRIVNYPEKERFTTSTSIQFRDLGHNQRMENIHLEKDDIRHTRRIMELANNKSISVAANITKSLGCKKDAIVRLKSYVG